MLNPNFFAATCFIKFKNFKETLTQNSAFFRKFFNGTDTTIAIILYYHIFLSISLNEL